MNTTFVCGHKNPDTDSIVSAMAYASLRNALGDNGYVAARLGHLNDESAFLLKKFDFEPPLHIYNVRTQVKDVEYDQPPLLGKRVPVSHAWEVVQSDKGNHACPITNENGTLFGMITAGTIAEADMDSAATPHVEDIPIFNLLSALEGRVINNEEDVFDSVSGDVMIALPTVGDVSDNLKKETVVICGQQPDVVKKALDAEVNCIILCQTDLPETYLGISSNTCIISTPYDAYRAARLLYQSIPVSRIADTENLVTFHLNDYLDDVRDTIIQSRFRSYPILDENERVVGTLSRYHLLRPNRKRVVLVDHNEMGQTIPGLDQAELVGIIDHHRLGDVQTGYPCFMRNEPVGSTTTIIATMYQEHGLMPGKQLSGLMAAAIISDTVMFKSPTSTPRDRRIAERLARIAGIDLEELGKEVFSAGQSSGKTVEDLLKTDFKEFHIADHKIAISQITTMDSASFIERKDEFLQVMGTMKANKEYDMILLMITDVLKEGTELLFLGDEEIIRQAFSDQKVENNRVFLKKVVSRKKQVVPALALLWG
ncbi:MAG: putative manganese-dependent inorganic diphosphatase [Oscillospiraceae bacterium]|nr:putative manganese-dependent inorganic diphosphatase [Oscillospiraceae bacterium]